MIHGRTRAVIRLWGISGDKLLRPTGIGCAPFGLLPASGVADEIELVTTEIEAQPETFLAFCQGDVNMPGNCVRRGAHLRLYDFDCGDFRHALTEGLAGRLTWGCVSRIPPNVLHEMDTAYREALMAECMSAHDNRLYARALAEAAGRWHIFHVIGRLPTALERDYQRGPTSLRQQFLAWLEAFAAIVEAAGHLTALGQAAQMPPAGCVGSGPQRSPHCPTFPRFVAERACRRICEGVADEPISAYP